MFQKERGIKMDPNIEAPWVGKCAEDYYDWDEEEKEEYIPEYYPECDADYDY